MSVLELVVKCGACKSNGEAKRMIKSGGLYLNNHRVESAGDLVSSTSLIDGQVCVVRTGKKSYTLVTCDAG